MGDSYALFIPAHYPELKRPVRVEKLPWEEDLGLLEELVRAGDGLVSVGIRPVGSPSSAASGLVEELSRSQMKAALEVLTGMGAEVLRVGKRLPMVLMTIDPRSAATIAKLPFVDHVSPSQELSFQSVRGSTPAVGTAAALGETTPWGVSKVQAPATWSFTTGSNVKIATLDSGLDYDHYVSGPEYSSANVIRCATWFSDSWSACLLGGSGTDDINAHGTHVMGIATAPKNGAGVVGVARNALNVVYRICVDTSCSILYAGYALDDLVFQGYSRSW